MIKITDKTSCCGCGACAQICPEGCIEMTEDEEGFLFPKADQGRCTGCEACERACPLIKRKQAESAEGKESSQKGGSGVFHEPKAFGGWIRDEKIREESSSGGAFSLLADYVLENGGIVFGASMSEDLKVRHIGIETSGELGKLRTSKYIQSITGDAYKEVRENLEKGSLVLFSGTPCQAAGLRSFLGNRRYENLYVLDLICRGVPSPMVFERYVDHLGQKYRDRIVNFRFRTKDGKWNPTGLQLGSGTRAYTEGGRLIRRSPGMMDPFMTGFSEDLYLRLSCHDCRFKALPKDYSDITLGDFWGVHRICPALYDGKGTSLVLINSERGEMLFRAAREFSEKGGKTGGFYCRPVDFHEAVRQNRSLVSSAKRSGRREIFFLDLRCKPFMKVSRRYMNPVVWFVHKLFVGRS